MKSLCQVERRKEDCGYLLGIDHLLREKYRSILLLGILLILCSKGFAQVETATLSGVVTDQSGAVIVGADVQVTNADTNITLRSATNSSGIYLVTGLKPGRYRVHVSKDGFKGIDLTDLTLNVQDSVSRNFALQIGSAAESITVDGSAPAINTENVAVSTVIDRKFVESLPLNGRSFNTLLQLTPGVVIASTSGQLGEGPGQFSMGGQRTTANTFLIDGAPANFGAGQFLAGYGTGAGQAFSALGGTSSLVSVEALDEFRVETSSFAPELGQTAGGQVILTTRSGTNTVHGELYEYFRNDVMDANDWFANQLKSPRPPERHNDFGGYLGGPIFKDKTFFFLSYEGARLRLPETAQTPVPSACARVNSPACPAGNQSASAAIAPFLNAFPKPNGLAPTVPCASQTPLGCVQQFTGSFSNSATLDATSVRVDHRISSRFSLFGRYNYAPSQTVQRFNSLSNFQPMEVDTQTLTIGSDMLLTNSLSNSVRANYSTQTSNVTNGLDSFGGATPLNPSLLLGPLSIANNLAGLLTFDGTFYAVGLSSRNKVTQVSAADDLTKTFGPHQTKFGANFRTLYLNHHPFNDQVLALAFSLQSLISSGAADILSTEVQLPARIRTDSFSLYGQDTWKLTPRLTVTYGLRWEVDPAPCALGNTKLAAWTNVNNPSTLAIAPPGTSLWSTTYTNFAPRAGVAYQLSPKGDLVLRVGGGLFYDQGGASAGFLAQNFPSTASGNGGFGVSLPIADPSQYLQVPPYPPFPFFVLGYSPNLTSPRSYQWNVALEKMFGGHQVLSATYVGQAGRDLVRQIALFQPNSSFTGEFLLTENDAFSNYDALQVQFRRPLSRGLQALLNYTWSHSLDNASNDVVAGFSHAVISGANDYGRSDFDVRHSFSGALDYSLLGAKSGPLALVTRGWSLDTVIVARSGFAFNGIIFGISPDPGGVAHSRPDRVLGQPIYVSGAQCASVFQGLGLLAAGQSCPGGKGLNPAAFSIPSTPRQGTEGRNDIPGFGLTQVDLSTGRRFPISERFSLQFRADAFNVLNHPNFTDPLAYIDQGPASLLSQHMLNQGLGGLNALFQEGGPRSLQLSLKLAF